jgi:hypothetical protein
MVRRLERRNTDLRAIVGLGMQTRADDLRTLGRHRKGKYMRRTALPDSSDIAVPENGKNAGKQRKFAAIDFARLNREVAGERLGHRQADRGHPRVPWSILLRHGA